MALDRSQRRLIASRYVGALFPMAVKANKHNTLLKEFAGFEAMIAESKDLQGLINNPAIDRDTKTAALEAVLKAGKASPLMRQFMKMLSEANRLVAFPEIVGAYKTALAKHNDQLQVIVTSAEPLTKAALTKIEKMVTASVERDVQIEAREDDALIGGITLNIGSTFYDYSVAGRLQHIQQQLQTAIAG